MRRLFFTGSFFLLSSVSLAQTGESIIDEIKEINKTVTSQHSGTVISNRAMNVFMADKTGYLSAGDDLSFYTNYVTFNSMDGIFTVNHNFQKPNGIDEPLKTLFSVGFKANVNSIGATFLDKQFDDELALTMNYKWLCKIKTHADKSQQKFMNALRAAAAQTLEIAIEKEVADFKTALNKIDTADVSGQNMDTAKALMQQNFYEEIKEKYVTLFSSRQAELLTKTNNFKLITFGYTSFTVTVPLVFPTYTVAPSFTASFAKKHSYPLQIMLQHTRLWESSKLGRLFLTLGANLLFSNSKLSYGVDKINISTYKNMGGADTLHLAENNKAYLGLYQTFFTPSLKARIVYYPTGSHIGISLMAAQNIGIDKLFNVRLGVPIVLINSKKVPAAAVECYVSFFDINHTVKNTEGRGKRIALGLSVGIPFSRLMY
ncbi:hypothetical protein [Ferruginibacter sp.]|uniref:hypothetical protein n=1 Tax=Ferruginibacter sp. TaxID=1940288 RepID=UPI001993ED89|nr:hypothetical protein [Ferruginibacter sp.]MBC7627690.1 hypothetical protein [Ferruginibacter sp.]